MEKEVLFPGKLTDVEWKAIESSPAEVIYSWGYRHGASSRSVVSVEEIESVLGAKIVWSRRESRAALAKAVHALQLRTVDRERLAVAVCSAVHSNVPGHPTHDLCEIITDAILAEMKGE